MNNAYDSRAAQQKNGAKKEKNPDIKDSTQKGINCCTNGVNNVTNFATTTWGLLLPSWRF